MNNKVKELFKDALTVKICQAFIVSSFIYLAIVVWKWRSLPPELPLYFSLPRGPEQLGTPVQLLILPILSSVIFVAHFFMAVFINQREKLAAKVLLLSALIVSIAMLISFIKIILLVA